MNQSEKSPCPCKKCGCDLVFRNTRRCVACVKRENAKKASLTMSKREQYIPTPRRYLTDEAKAMKGVEYD